MDIVLLLVLLAASAALAAWSRHRAHVAEADHRPAHPADARQRNRRGRRHEPDPFDVLTVQLQLARLSAHIRALDADPTVWARGRRMIATQSAYDAVLAEACRMAGVDLGDPRSLPLPEPERFREEMELTARGWSW